MLPRILVPLLLVPLASCGRTGGGPPGGSSRAGQREYALPVRTELPGRGEVEDYVVSQSTLESDLQAAVHAQIEGEIEERLRDVGDTVGATGDGDEPYLLARIDDRELQLSLSEAEIKLEQAKGKLKELELERRRAERDLEQARVELEEAETVLARTTSGIRDGTISIEEHERAKFARDLAENRVQAAQASLEQSQVTLDLGSVAIREAEVARDRAQLAADRARIVAPLRGVVTVCNVRAGELVGKGDLLYVIEDPTTLVVYADVPVRQAARVSVGDEVRLSSNATNVATTGRVELVAPTVDRESGTVRVKVRVDAAAGYRPGLFVALEIVVARRPDALVVPKRAVLHHDEDGAYLFTVADGRAHRRLVETGFEKADVVEIASGLEPNAAVVVEGQDTLSDGALVAPEETPPAPAETPSAGTDPTR